MQVTLRFLRLFRQEWAHWAGRKPAKSHQHISAAKQAAIS
jgi:hypothetical protein